MKLIVLPSLDGDVWINPEQIILFNAIDESSSRIWLPDGNTIIVKESPGTIQRLILSLFKE